MLVTLGKTYGFSTNISNSNTVRVILTKTTLFKKVCENKGHVFLLGLNNNRTCLEKIETILSNPGCLVVFGKFYKIRAKIIISLPKHFSTKDLSWSNCLKEKFILNKPHKLHEGIPTKLIKVLDLGTKIKLLEKYNTIIIQGGQSIGKCYQAKLLAKQYNQQEPTIIVLSQKTQLSNLFNNVKFIEESSTNKHQYIKKEGVLLKWLKNKNPPILILVGFNFTKYDIRCFFTSLFSGQRRVTYAGEIYSLSPKHRIIVIQTTEAETLNIDSIKLSNQKQDICHINCTPLSIEEMVEKLVYPNLYSTFSTANKEIIKVLFLKLLSYYQDIILPKKILIHDVFDVLARFNNLASFKDLKVLTKSEIHTTLWCAFEESALCSSAKKINIGAYRAVSIFHTCHYKFAPKVIVEREKAFNFFYSKLLENFPHARFCSVFKEHLIKPYWLFLSTFILYPTFLKRVFVVEGDAGIGKDFWLNAVFETFKALRKIHHFTCLNANPKRIHLLENTIDDAYIGKYPVGMSEGNLLSSDTLPSLLSEILVNNPISPVCFIITQNPSSEQFGGREDFNELFENRCIMHKVKDFSIDEIKQIIIECFPSFTIKRVTWIVECFDKLNKLFNRHNIRLTIKNLFMVCSDLNIVAKDEDDKLPLEIWYHKFKNYFIWLNWNEGKCINYLKSESAGSSQTNDLNKRLNQLQIFANKISTKPVILQYGHLKNKYSSTTNKHRNIVTILLNKKSSQEYSDIKIALQVEGCILSQYQEQNSKFNETSQQTSYFSWLLSFLPMTRSHYRLQENILKTKESNLSYQAKDSQLHTKKHGSN